MTLSHLDLLLRLHPRSPWNLDDGSTYRADLEVAGEGLDLAWAQRDALMSEIFPVTVSALLTRWEEEMDCRRTAGKSAEERLAAVVARYRILPTFRPLQLAELLTTLAGLDVAIVEPFGFHCDATSSVCDEEGDVLGAFLFWATLDEDAARTAELSRAELDYFIRLIKPAHTLGHVRCDDFAADDEWSVCDLDILGV